MDRQKNDLMDCRKIVRRNTEKLPIDLVIEILSRLPAKSIAICRCVSKQWDSLLGSQVFMESFLTNSLSRPRILFTVRCYSKFHVFSSPQPQKFDDNSSVVATEYYHMGAYENCYVESCRSVHGFIYLSYMSPGTPRDRTQVICNPCTRQHITLPKLETRYLDMRSFFGYDPIQKQYKVLCRTTNDYKKQASSYKYQVLTLGTGELLWRNIECPFLCDHIPSPGNNGVCINGVIYYIAKIINGDSNTTKIVCFDVSSEKFSFIEIEKPHVMTLISFKGKLGVLVFISHHSELWVLDDINQVKWSKHIFFRPNIAVHAVKSMWATDRGEIVWASDHWTHPLYVFYYNMERQSVRRVEIKVMEDKISKKGLLTYTNHVENLMFLYKKPGLIHGKILNQTIKMDRQQLTTCMLQEDINPMVNEETPLRNGSQFRLRKRLTRTAYASSFSSSHYLHGSTLRFYKSSGKRMLGSKYWRR